MKVTIISQSLGHETLAIAGAVTGEHLHRIAEAFTKSAAVDATGQQLRLVFGHWSFRSYVIGLGGPHRAKIMFSMRAKPELLMFRGGPAGISDEHAAKFELYVTTVEAITLPSFQTSSHPCDAGVPNG